MIMCFFGKKKKKASEVRQTIAPVIKEEGQLSAYDELTGVLGRERFAEDAAECIRTYVGSPIAFCYMSTGNIGAINNKYGMDGGNKLLREIARELTSYDNRLIVTRDVHHFMFMTVYEDEDQLEDWLTKLHDMLSGVGKVLPGSPKVFMHTGVYATGGHLIDMTAHEMLEKAFLANREAAKRTHSSIIFYSDQLQIALEEEKILERDMHDALESKQFAVDIQLRFDINSDEVIGGKMMSHWNHPQRGVVAAYRYVPLFVKNGFIIKLDIYVLEQTCALVRQWLDKGFKPLKLSVSVPRLLVTESEQYLPIYLEMKKKYNIPDRLIELDFSERLIDDSFEKAKEVIEKLIESGYLCAVDNFGSGMTAEETVNDIGFSAVELTHDFFEDKVLSEDEIQTIIRAVELAHGKNLAVVAVGMPDELIDELRTLGCDAVQARLSRQPIHAESFSQYLKSE